MKELSATQDVIGALEAAKEGGRDLDMAIAVVLNGGSFTCFSSETMEAYFPPPYTTSLDAALTLVPEGWVMKIGQMFHPTVEGIPLDTWRVTLNRAGVDVIGEAGGLKETRYNGLPLALVIAALKARHVALPSSRETR